MALDPALGLPFKSHPWHGVAIGPEAPERVTVFIEIVPSDNVKHYFLTYKQAPADTHPACELLRVYGRSEACEVIRRSQTDYRERFAPVLGPHLGQG